MTVDKDLSVDEQIEKLFDNAYILPYHPVPDTAGELRGNLKPLIKSLIRQVCEEVIAKPSLRCGSVLEVKSDDYRMGDANGYNECYTDSMAKLNKIFGKGEL